MKENRLVGIFLKGSNPSRTYPYMLEVRKALEKKGYRTITLDRKINGKYEYNLRQVGALAEQCDIVVCSNTFGFHLVGSLNKRAVAIFGYCDGEIWVQDYPKVTACQIDCPYGKSKCWWQVSCVPGRNLREKEVKTAPPCLEKVPVEMVVAEVDRHFTQTKRILVVVLTWNLLHKTREMVNSVRSFHNYDIMIVDNASTDGTQEWAKRAGVECISQKCTVPTAWNIGQKKALEGSYDYSLLCNNDCILSDTYIDTVVGVAERRKSYGVTGTVINAQTASQIRAAEILKDVEQPISQMIPGDYSALLLSRECLEKIGAFQSFAPRYQSDEDHLLRIRLSGHDIIKTYATAFYHRHGSVVQGFSEAKRKKEWNMGVERFKRKWHFDPYMQRNLMNGLNGIKNLNPDWEKMIRREL